MSPIIPSLNLLSFPTLIKSSPNSKNLQSMASMATFTNFLPKQTPYLPPIPKPTPLNFNHLPTPKENHLIHKLYTTAATRRAAVVAKSSAAAAGVEKVSRDERVQKVHNIAEFDEALKKAKDRLVVVEYAASGVENSAQIYPFMVELSRSCSDVDFLLVMGDESEATRALCKRENVDQVPHFTFYKSMEKIHEEEAIGPEQLEGDVLYYGDSHSAVVQLHSREDVEKLIADHKSDGQLIVLDVGLKHCGPCVKVYPTVIKLSRSMKGTVVFARMNGDENDSCMQFLSDMEVVEVPTFLFIRDGVIAGRYVGSGKGELIGEILRYQGVRVTY